MATKDEVEYFRKNLEADLASEVLLELIYGRKNSNEFIEKEVFEFFKNIGDDSKRIILKRFFLMAGSKLGLFTNAVALPKDHVYQKIDKCGSKDPFEDEVKPKYFLEKGFPLSLSKKEIEKEIEKAIIKKNYLGLNDFENRVNFHIASFASLKIQNENGGEEPKLNKDDMLEYSVALWMILLRKKNEIYANN